MKETEKGIKNKAMKNTLNVVFSLMGKKFIMYKEQSTLK